MNTIKIGNQEWMLENLNITDEYLGKDHWKNSETDNVYYSWKAAVRMSKKVEGFHLPSAEDWNKLAESFTTEYSYNHKSKRIYYNLQNLVDRLNIKYYDSGAFYSPIVGCFTKERITHDTCFDNFWTSTEHYRNITFQHKSFDTRYRMIPLYDYQNYGFSVRLVKNL